jgi:hypothetical protein
MSCYSTTGQNHNIIIANKFFENVAKFRYFGAMVINRNGLQDEIKNRLNSASACYHAVQNVRKLKD